MKNWFKVSVTLLIFGWIPFAFLSAWGHNQMLEVRIGVALIGFILCFMGMGGLLAFLSNKDWWSSLSELETSKKKYDEAFDAAVKAKNIFTNKILELETENLNKK